MRYLLILICIFGCSSRGIILYQTEIGDRCVSTTLGNLPGRAILGITIDGTIDGSCFNGKIQPTESETRNRDTKCHILCNHC